MPKKPLKRLIKDAETTISTTTFNNYVNNRNTALHIGSTTAAWFSPDLSDVHWKAKELIEAFMTKHKALEEFFCSSHGLELQRKDSDIVDKILSISLEQNIPVLPIHDSFIVRQSDEQKLLDMIMSEYRNVMGFDPVLHAA